MTNDTSSGRKVAIDYDGEFGPELQTVLPFAYHLHLQGRLGATVGCEDTKSLYYFSEDHKEQHARRRFMWPHERAARGIPNPTEHVPRLRTDQWAPPPYKKHFRNNRFVWSREPLVVLNKYGWEWDEGTFNYIDLETLRYICEEFGRRYRVIYCRPLPGDIVEDDNTIREYDDFKLIAEFPEVVTMQQLHRTNPDLTFNELQLMVYANCRNFVSVQGGNSVLASYFGGTNVVLIQKGMELECGDYLHFRAYSGSRVAPCTSAQQFRRVLALAYGARSATSSNLKLRGVLVVLNARVLGRYLSARMRMLCRRLLTSLLPTAGHRPISLSGRGTGTPYSD